MLALLCVHRIQCSLVSLLSNLSSYCHCSPNQMLLFVSFSVFSRLRNELSCDATDLSVVCGLLISPCIKYKLTWFSPLIHLMLSRPQWSKCLISDNLAIQQHGVRNEPKVTLLLEHCICEVLSWKRVCNAMEVRAKSEAKRINDLLV